MDILHTEASCGWGGQEIRILDESTGMLERGHRVALACPPHAPIARAATERGIELIALPIEKKRPRGLLAMRGLLRARRFDVVNTHSSTDSWLVALSCASLAGAPPVVRTRHISAPVAPGIANRWLYARSASRVVTTGETLREELIARVGCDPERIVSIPTGQDEMRFVPGDPRAARAALGLPEGFYVGIVATLRSWKGHRYLIEAVRAAEVPGLRLLIVGEGPMHDALREQVAAASLGEKIVFAGQQRDVVPWMQALDLFALPSYANEGVPQALVQAMLCGLPCITTAVGAIPEIAIADRTALVVAPMRADALVEAIEALARDADRRRALGAAARERCLAGYTRAAMLERMEQVFAQACGARRARP